MATDKKRIAIAAEFSDTGEAGANGRFSYMARALAARYDVTLFTSNFSHTAKKHFSAPDIPRPFHLKLIHEPGYRKNVEPARLASHKKFGENLYRTLAQENAFDLVYVAVPSIDAGLAVRKYALGAGIPYVVDIQDLWPEAFELVFKVPVLSGAVFAPMRRAVRSVYADAARIVAVSETYAGVGARANKAGAAALPVFLGTELAAFDAAVGGSACQADLLDRADGEVRIAYIGTLGHSYDLGVVIEALAMLSARGMRGLKFVVMGDGPLQEKFVALAEERGVDAEFTGRLPYEQMAGRLAGCHIAVNPIAKGAAQSIINKVGDYAAAGLPVVSTQENPEYRALLSGYGAGINCEDCPENVADAIELLVRDPSKRKAMGAAGRRLAEERFDRARTYPAIYELIDSLL